MIPLFFILVKENLTEFYEFRYYNSIVNKEKESSMSNMDFNISYFTLRHSNDGTKLLVDSSGKNAWGSTAQESVDGAIADFVAEGGEAKILSQRQLI